MSDHLPSCQVKEDSIIQVQIDRRDSTEQSKAKTGTNDTNDAGLDTD